MNDAGLPQRQAPTTTAAKSDPLAELLRGTWPDPDGGSPIAVPVLSVAIERSLAGSEAERVRSLPVERRFAIISDATTHRLLGARVQHALASVGKVLPVVLDDAPHPDTQTVEKLRRACAAMDTLVAVGSGTINDLCKYAAAKDGKPYLVFATAPSMNGYTSMNAAITVDGHKKTLPAAAPVGVFMDLEVLAAAPARMIRAGLGDSLCRSTAQADWLLSHHLLDTPYRRAPFALLADDEPALLDAPEALLQGDLDAMRALARTLVLSGLGMTICHGSYPASQGEHQISHYLDMFAPPDRASYFHGEQVAVATLTMARIQQAVLADGPPRFAPSSIGVADFARRFGPEIGESCWQEFATKRLTHESAAKLTQRIADNWGSLRNTLSHAMLPSTRIEAVLTRAGCPTTPAEIGVAADFYAETVRNARFLRDRYTFLDFADDSGRLAEIRLQ